MHTGKDAMPRTGAILVVEDDEAVALTIAGILAKAGYAVRRCGDGRGARDALARERFAAVCLDLGLPDCDGVELISVMRRHQPHVPVIVLTADARIETVVAAMRSGAENYLAKPVQGHRLLAALRKGMDDAKGVTSPLIGESAAMRRLLDEVSQVAGTPVTVLLHGESGTGKELLARAIHDQSPRRAGPLIAVNCAAIPDSLHEAELFGYEKGAFTGANQRTLGKFELAHGGTLFLDEIGELAPALQAKLLRALQERSFYRVGGATEIAVDFRLIAATHRDLAAAVANGTFREDLFFRIAAVELDVPPLRDREDDVIQLAQQALAEFSRQLGHDVAITDDVAAALRRYPWPGNVRELRNSLQRACIFAKDGRITVEDLGPRVAAAVSAPRVSVPANPATPTATTAFATGTQPKRGMRALLAEHRALTGPDRDRREREIIAETLTLHAQNLSQAARALGIGRTTLYRKMKKHRMT